MQGAVLVTNYPNMNKIQIFFQEIYCLTRKREE